MKTHWAIFYFRSIELFALHMNLYQEVALSFKKVGDPLTRGSRWNQSWLAIPEQQLLSKRLRDSARHQLFSANNCWRQTYNNRWLQLHGRKPKVFWRIYEIPKNIWGFGPDCKVRVRGGGVNYFQDLKNSIRCFFILQNDTDNNKLFQNDTDNNKLFQNDTDNNKLWTSVLETLTITFQTGFRKQFYQFQTLSLIITLMPSPDRSSTTSLKKRLAATDLPWHRCLTTTDTWMVSSKG